MSDLAVNYTIEQAARAVGVSRHTLWRMERAGKLATIRFGTGKRKIVRVPRSEVLRLTGQAVTPEPGKFRVRKVKLVQWVG